MDRKRMTTGIANNAAIVFEEAPDASTGIIFTTVLYSVRDVGRFVVEPCKS
jgi:hypothetical protein